MDDGSSLRRRVATQGRNPPSSIRTDEDDSKDTKLAKTLRKFDVYARVDEDLTVRTESGATVTVVFWVLLLLLVSICDNSVQENNFRSLA
jgi:Endoplasmic Reticulum-Golgi Intermediate Compartment (ERGIC)